MGPSPSPRVTITFGTEAPSSSNSTTELTTVATGKWTFTSGNPSRCQHHTSSSSLLRPGIQNLSTGTSTRGKRLNSPLTTKPNENEVDNEEPKAVAAAEQIRRTTSAEAIFRRELIRASFDQRRNLASGSLNTIHSKDSFSIRLGLFFYDPLETPILNPPVSREIFYVFVTFILFITYHL